jgi:sigma-B regulation protein RsbQ
MIETNMLGWASFLAPVVMGAQQDPALIDELKASFCAIDPHITRCFARATFFADNRADLPGVQVPTLVVQMADDAIAPPVVGEYVRRQVPDCRLVVLDGCGHCPHMTHPAETIAAIRAFLADGSPSAPARRLPG